MSTNNYGEIFCQAAEILAQHLIDKVSYDKTLLCTITDDSEKSLGKYRVSNGEAIFDAYTSDTSFRKNDQVYVSVPSGDWNEQKLIVAKKMNNINQPITYKDPFDNFINITNNLIDSSLTSQGLIANDTVKKQVLLWSYNKNDSDALVKSSGEILGGYTRLAISADFQAWLKELGVVVGDYGLNLIVETGPEDAADIVADGNVVNSNIKVCSLNCLDMIGNPYNYESYYTQKKLFDISGLKNIKSLELWFYQKAGSFYDHNGKLISNKNPNIFVKNAAISLGYDTENFTNDTLILYSMDTQKYDVKKSPLTDNHKRLQVRWIHKFEDGTIKVVQPEDEIDYEMVWYRYELGARSHTAWSGVDWIPLSSQVSSNKNILYNILDPDWTEYNENSTNITDTPIRKLAYNQSWLLPDITRAEEKIKVILTCEGQVFYSDILIFSNVEEVVNKATVDAIQALTINCEDDSFGNYLIYDLGGRILDQAESSKTREFKAYFNSAADDIDDNIMAQLTEAESIEWIIPTENTMIILDGFISGNVEDNYKDENGYYHIFRYGEKGSNSIVNQNSQRYKIDGYYSNNKNNNTIKCIVTKNSIKYTTTKELTFGPAGTSGTDYSFVLDFNSGITALTLASDYAADETIPAVMVRARLYDYTGKEIPNLELRNIQWSLVETSLKNAEVEDNILENDFIKIIPQEDKNKVEIQLLDTVTEIPENNFTVLKAVLKKSNATGDTGWGDYDLYAYLPIPIRSSRKYQFISGTTTILYNSLGYLDNYFQNPYKLYYMNDDNTEVMSANGIWAIYSGVENDPYIPKVNINSDGQYSIRPINIYVEDSMQDLCIVGSFNGSKVWSQPLFTMQNKYPSSIINDWNGELTIDNENNAILAAKVAAGKKNDDNTFSGVMMGDWSGNDTSSAEGAITKNTGIYGFQKGVASFGFRDDGTAFIGKPGAGRLEFDGNKSIIQSNSFASKKGGLSLDFDKGLIELYEPEKEHNKNRSIILDADAKTYPFSIGSYFKVNWDGTVNASNGHFSGTIYAWDGYFSGSITASDINGGTITGSTISAAEINGGTISGTEIITDKLFAGTTSGYKYQRWNRKDTKSEWEKSAETYVFTDNNGDPYYPNNNADTALVKYTYIEPITGAKAAHLGTFTGGINAIDPETGKETIETTQVCGIEVIENTEYPLVLRSTQRALLKSDKGDVMIMSGGQLGLWGNSLRCHIAKDKQFGIYARFA